MENLGNRLGQEIVEGSVSYIASSGVFFGIIDDKKYSLVRVSEENSPAIETLKKALHEKLRVRVPVKLYYKNSLYDEYTLDGEINFVERELPKGLLEKLKGIFL